MVYHWLQRDLPRIARFAAPTIETGRMLQSYRQGGKRPRALVAAATSLQRNNPNAGMILK